MNLLDRFSSHLRDALARSIHLAAELKNPSVEPIHLFFSIANQKGSVATEIINRFKITPQTLEQGLLSLPSKKDALLYSAAETAQNVLTPLSPSTKSALEKAMLVAEEFGHNYIGTEHLLAALLKIDDILILEVLAINSVNSGELKKQLDTVFSNASQFPEFNEMTEAIERIEENISDRPEGPMEPPHDHKRGNHKKKKESALGFFGVELTSKEAQKQIDPVIGRDEEIERVIQIICRRTKNNPLLLGEPGVGKTAIVEGLAKKIMEGTVPDILLNKKIYSLDMSLLIAGTIYRGEFEARLRQVIDEAAENPNIIVFIDELHNIVGAGANQGAMDAANILKPALSRGQLRCIGATTPQEYKKYIENDPALERRFQPIYAKEPSPEDTIHILNGIRKNYEAYHKIQITDEAVAAAVHLSERYIPHKFLPDKAIDLLDETSAAKRLTFTGPTPQSKLSRLEQKLEKIILAKENAAKQDKFAEAVKLKKEEEDLRALIKKTAGALETKKVRLIGSIDQHDVARQVAKIIGTKPSELMLDVADNLALLEEKLGATVVGQTTVIRDVSQLIRQAKLGLSHPDRPLGSFLFVGESGVGKTELAKQIARVLYSNPEALIRLDMSEFNESFGVSKLLGSPAGYIGYKESNQFTDKIKMNPYSVILLDEIDKAHRDIIKLLLQMLESGELTDSTGKKISLRQTIIILTTSLGSDEVRKTQFGFGRETTTAQNTRAKVMEKLKEFFTPEIINRLDAICLFEPLAKETLVRIAELELQKFNERLQPYHTSLSSEGAVLEWLVGKLPANQNGARDVRRSLRAEIETLMSSVIVQRKLKKSYSLKVRDEKLAIL